LFFNFLFFSLAGIQCYFPSLPPAIKDVIAKLLRSHSSKNQVVAFAPMLYGLAMMECSWTELDEETCQSLYQMFLKQDSWNMFVSED
jgi:hypothetical protein